MSLFDDFRQMRDMYRQGPRQTFAWAAAFLIFFVPYVSSQVWLKDRLSWPENYGFYCHRKCFFEDLANSPQLLQKGDLYEIGLFATFWLLPAIITAVLIYSYIAKRRRDRNPILAMKSED